MPTLIYRACLKTGKVSNTVYIQHAVAEALARDLEIPLERILARLPEPRAAANRLMEPRADLVGPGGTVESVRERRA